MSTPFDGTVYCLLSTLYSLAVMSTPFDGTVYCLLSTVYIVPSGPYVCTTSRLIVTVTGHS